MLLKAIVLLKLFWFALVNGKNNDLLNAVTSFLVQDHRPTSVLIPNLCWEQHQVKILAKQLSQTGIRISDSLEQNKNEFYLQHLVVMVDLACPGVDHFLEKANKDGYFKSPYRWLMFNLRNDYNGTNILEAIDMLVDSDVVAVNEVEDNTFEFIEVYRVAKNSDLIYTTRSMWFPTNKDLNNSLSEVTGTDNIKPYASTYQKKTTFGLMSDLNNDNTAVQARGFLKDYRLSKVLSSKRHNLRRHTLTMVNVITDSNETRKHLDDRLYLHQDSITKMSYTAVKICFEMLNASEKLIFTHTWGYKDKHGNWQGIVDYLDKKEADLGTLTIFTQERMEIIDYIAMVGSTAVKFVFREPPLSYISNIFTQPFSRAVWLAIIVCVLGCSVFLYITSKWEASISMHQFQLNGSWADIIILIIGAVLQQGCTLEPRYAAGRTVTLLLFLALTILYAAYSANIVVLLRAPSSSVRTLSDLLNSPLKLGASDFEYNRYFFKKLNEPIRKAIYDKKIAPKGKKPNFYSMKEGVEKIRRGLFAFHMESNPGYRLIQETYQEDEKCDLVEIDYINEIDPWVPGQKKSPYKDLFKINFIKIRESGIQSCIHRRLHVPRPRCSGAVSAFSSVGIADMYPAMLATVYMTLLAPVVLLLELAYHRLASSVTTGSGLSPQAGFLDLKLVI
ncbi:unnamed protein product [Chilo suppressalis]|uniref:Ionotropic glutamate receptor C-terminal domain-containing protein n=1 Tax=Chilo suppressalis TaxID=168631 RepID=A0ABN8B4N2_CHISP|nr:unnamed protein product [Chilo suppressalis]